MSVVLNCLLIFFGGIFILVAIRHGTKLSLQLKDTEFESRWSKIVWLMKFFVPCFVAAFYLVAARRPEYNQYLEELTGITFFSGAVFVYNAVSLTHVMASRLVREVNELKKARFELIATTQDLRRSEVAIKSSEEKLRIVVENSPQAAAMFDLDMKYLLVSRRWMSDYNMVNREVIGHSHYELFPEIPERWKEMHHRGLRGEIVRTDSDRVERADGSVQYVNWEIRPWYKNGGEVGGILIFSEDISERKLAVDRLSESEARFRATFEQAAVGEIQLSMPSGKIVQCNKTICKMLGYTEDELMKIEFLKITHRDDQAASIDALEKIKSGQTVDFEKRYLSKSGGIVWARVVGSPIKNSRGEITSTITIIQDITQQKHAREEIERSRQLLDLHVKQTPLGVIQWDLDFKVKDWNPSAEKIFGYAANDAFGRHSDFIVPESARAHVHWVWDELLRKRGGFRSGNENLTKEGKLIYCEWYNTPLINSAGEVVGVASLVEDVTERRRIENEREMLLTREREERVNAEKLVKARDEFISIASHELKTPLTALRMQFQIIPKLFNKIEFAEKIRLLELFQNSLSQLEHFSHLTEDLLEVSRINVGRLVLDFEDVNLAELVTRVVNQYQNDLKRQGCELTTCLDLSIRGTWDLVRVEQIMTNLLTNAMKYGAGAPIEIVTRRVDGSAQISVRDHGIGISKEDQKKIFERFERAAPVKQYRGLGLGLYIVRQIVEAHQGRIWVESETGQGSTFFVELPLERK